MEENSRTSPTTSILLGSNGLGFHLIFRQLKNPKTSRHKHLPDLPQITPPSKLASSSLCSGKSSYRSLQPCRLFPSRSSPPLPPRSLVHRQHARRSATEMLLEHHKRAIGAGGARGDLTMPSKLPSGDQICRP
jgi:hypothetical protein